MKFIFMTQIVISFWEQNAITLQRPMHLIYIGYAFINLCIFIIIYIRCTPSVKSMFRETSLDKSISPPIVLRVWGSCLSKWEWYCVLALRECLDSHIILFNLFLTRTISPSCPESYINWKSTVGCDHVHKSLRTLGQGNLPSLLQ